MAKSNRFTVKWASIARADLSAIIEHVAQDDRAAALSVLTRIERAASALVRMPLRGRIVPELAAIDIRTYGEIIVSPWRIVYRVSGNTVFVLAVVDGRRNVEDLLLERFLR